MRTILLLTLSFLAMTETHAQFSKERKVIIFGAPGSEAVQQQLNFFKKDAAGISDRDISILMAARQTSLYRKYRVEPSVSFTLVLVGKDGGEKLRAEKPVTAQDLFNIIDAMPMRQSEMRRGRKQ